MIEVNNVSLILDKKEILKNINVHFEKGKIHGLVGHNGSGKTMLMKCICGLIKPTYGKIVVNGEVVGRKSDFPESMGIIIENPGFLPYYSGYRNLKILADLAGKIGKEEIKSTMQLVGLDPNLRLPVKKYSLGMRQRLGLAQAIMEDPELLVLDEPMNGLDKDGVRDMRGYLLHMREQGKTIVIASHSMEDIEVLCDEFYEMEKGQLGGTTGTGPFAPHGFVVAKML